MVFTRGRERPVVPDDSVVSNEDTERLDSVKRVKKYSYRCKNEPQDIDYNTRREGED